MRTICLNRENTQSLLKLTKTESFRSRSAVSFLKLTKTESFRSRSAVSFLKLTKIWTFGNGYNYLRSHDKYYVCDRTLKRAKLGAKNLNYGAIYENMVAMELLRRGYNIYVGTLREKEVDFMAMRRDEKTYLQVSYDISTTVTLEREVKSLLR